jgi:hypothetical protein
LLKRREEQDDLWRWQARLWGECVRLSTLVALRRLPGARIAAEAPLLIRADQLRGQWADLPPHPAVVIVPADDRRIAVTVIDAGDEAAREFGTREIWPHLWSVGPACVLHAQDLASREETWIAIWSLHPMDGRELDLREEARSADRALRSVRDELRKKLGLACRLRGVVVASALGGVVGEGSHGDALAYRCPVGAESLSGLVDTLAEMLPVLVGA